MKQIILIVSFFLCFSSIYAQLVNVETMRYARKDGWQGVFELSGNLTQNTKQIAQAKNTIGIQYTKSAHTIMLFNSFSIMKVNSDDALVNSGFQHFRYNYYVPSFERITLEYFVQHQYNTVKLLKTRFVSGIGPRFAMFAKENLHFYLAPLLMYEYESLSDANSTTSGTIKWDAYASVAYKLSKTVSLGTVTYYQPVIDNYMDFRVSSDNYISFSVNKRLSFIVAVSVDYDSDPPEEINSLFYTLTNTFKVKF